MGAGAEGEVGFSPKTAVGTTYFADNTDKEGIAVEGVFTRRVAAKEVLDPDKARSPSVISAKSVVSELPDLV